MNFASAPCMVNPTKIGFEKNAWKKLCGPKIEFNGKRKLLLEAMQFFSWKLRTWTSKLTVIFWEKHTRNVFKMVQKWQTKQDDLAQSFYSDKLVWKWNYQSLFWELWKFHWKVRFFRTFLFYFQNQKLARWR